MHAYVLVYILAASLNISSLIGLWNLSGESRLTFDVGNDSRDLLQSIAVVLPALLIHSNLFTSVGVTICLCCAIIKMCESLICGLSIHVQAYNYVRPDCLETIHISSLRGRVPRRWKVARQTEVLYSEDCGA